MMARIADWHGEQAAKAYCEWQRTGHHADLNRFLRHTMIADRVWRSTKKSGVL